MAVLMRVSGRWAITMVRASLYGATVIITKDSTGKDNAMAEALTHSATINRHSQATGSMDSSMEKEFIRKDLTKLGAPGRRENCLVELICL